MRSNEEKAQEAKVILESLNLPGFSIKSCRSTIDRALREGKAKSKQEIGDLKILKEWLDDVEFYFRT